MEQMLQAERKLAAIMFTDMASFSEAFDKNEAHALQRLDTNNKFYGQNFKNSKGRK